MYIPKEQINSFFQDINSFGISYVLIKNMDDELPAHLENGKDIDILVKEEDKDLFAQKMLRLGYNTCTHPLGIANGWAFAYGLPECQFWKKPETNGCNRWKSMIYILMHVLNCAAKVLHRRSGFHWIKK